MTPVERFHTRLVKSAPAKDTVLAAAPASVQLWFSEQIDLTTSRVQLVDAAAKPVPTAALTRDDTKADQPVVARVSGALANGVYTVNWSTASDDGHAVKGSFNFTVKKP